MKIVVYTIAKDEGKNVESFVNSCKEADAIYVGVDVRTTDDTLSKLNDMGVITIPIDVKPWDFSKARNIVLSHIPKDVDICVAIDLDEVLNIGWRKILERVWDKDLTQLYYKYIYGWEDKEMKIPSIVIQGYRIHKNGCYVWQNPVHENLKFIGEDFEEKSKHTDEIILYHYPDLLKERKYLDIIKDAISIDPKNSWLVYLKARENFTKKNFTDCHDSCLEYLNMTFAYQDIVTCESRAECCRMIARCHHILNLEDKGEKVTWMLRAVSENHNERENWVYLGEAWSMFGNKLSAVAAFNNALNIKDRFHASQNEERCWDDNYLINAIKQLTEE